MSPPPRREAFRHLVRRHGRDSTVEQTLNAGLSRWMHDAPEASGTKAPAAESPAAGVAYAVSRFGGRRVWVAAGGPVCPPDARVATARAFEAVARQAGAQPVWFGVDAATVAALGPGHTALSVGAEPVWDPAGWAATVDGRASLRSQVRRAARHGVTVREEPAAQAARDAAAILRFWLTTRGMAALAFLADPHILNAPGDRRAFVARDGTGSAVGVLWLAPVPARRAWLVEWIWRGAGAPNGVTDGLLDAAVRALASEGAASVSLGLVPLSTAAPRAGSAPTPAVRLLVAWTRAHARRFYRFDGLEQFKAKYRPDAWVPLYLVTTGERVGLDALAAVASVFAGRRGVVRLVGGALGRAALDEARTARARLPRRR